MDFKQKRSIQACNSKEKREVQPVVEKSQKRLYTNKPRKLSSKQKREFEMIEGKIAQLES